MDHEDRYLCDSVGHSQAGSECSVEALRGERRHQEAGIVLYGHPEKKQQAHGGSGSIMSPSLWSRDARPRLDKRGRMLKLRKMLYCIAKGYCSTAVRWEQTLHRGCEAALFSVSHQLTEAKGAHP